MYADLHRYNTLSALCNSAALLICLCDAYVSVNIFLRIVPQVYIVNTLTMYIYHWIVSLSRLSVDVKVETSKIITNLKMNKWPRPSGAGVQSTSVLLACLQFVISHLIAVRVTCYSLEISSSDQWGKFKFYLLIRIHSTSMNWMTRYSDWQIYTNSSCYRCKVSPFAFYITLTFCD